MRFVRKLRLLIACAALLPLASAQVQIKPLLDLDGETSAPTLSPDGKTLAFQWCKPDYSCGIYTRPLSGGPVKLFATQDNRIGTPDDPVWSPDGNIIAFTRFYSRHDVHLFTEIASGGAEHDLGSVCSGPVTWSRDGRFLVASSQAKTGFCRPALYSPTAAHTIRPLAKKGETPALSPDGRSLAYADYKTLMLLHLDADGGPIGPATTLAREPREISGVSWTPDGKQVIYQTWGDEPYLRRLARRPGSRPEAIPGLTADLSISQTLSDGNALATETTAVEALWRVDLRSNPVKAETVARAECSDGDPECSPDGRLRAFVTTRTGLAEIWLANADGTNEHPLVKTIPALVAPHADGFPEWVGWSPDQRWIAFTVGSVNGNADLRTNLYVISPSGGPLRRLAKQESEINGPVWSRDGKSIYGWRSLMDVPHDLDSQLVRVEVADGAVSLLSAHGIWPRPTLDGRSLFFFDSLFKLSRIRIDGGGEERIWEQGDILWLTYAVGTRYLYLFQSPPQTSSSRIHTIVRFDPQTRQSTPLGEVPFEPRGAYLSPEEHFLYFKQEDLPNRRVVLVRGLY
jgi:Tol biopolymer transport system component